MFKKSILTDKVAIELKTKEEVDNLCDWLESEAYQVWGRSVREDTLNHSPCICPRRDEHSARVHYEKEGYKILSYQEALEDPKESRLEQFLVEWTKIIEEGLQQLIDKYKNQNKIKELQDKMEEVKNRHNKELEEIQEELNSLKDS